MKVVSLRDAKAGLSSVVDDAQADRVLITRHGKPAVLMIGVEGEDLEDLMTMGNPRFWEMIEARRKGTKTVSLDDVKKRFGIDRGEKRHRDGAQGKSRRRR